MDTNTYQDFRVYGKQLVDYICDYMKSIDKRDVNPVKSIDAGPGFMAPLFPKEAPNQPDKFEDIMKDIEDKIMAGTLHWQHPNFFAYFGNGIGYPSVLADMISSTIGIIGFSWASCPAMTELEAVVLDWYAKAIGLPEYFLSKNSNPNSVGGGSIQASASDAIYSCMFAAQKRATKKMVQTLNICEGECLPKLVAYASNQAHSCVEKAAMMNLVEFRSLQPDFNDRLTGDTLEKAILKDIADGLTPFFVVATMGTTGQAAFDHLDQIAQVTKKYPSIWLHADGAYGGSSFLLPEMRPKGLDFLDSIEVNPNKSMLTAFDCTCCWVKNVEVYTEAFVVDPIYLKHENESKIIDLRHYGTPLSRRFRALKLFFMFRMFGLKRLRSFIKRIIAMGKYFEELMKADDRFEMMNMVTLGVVCFRLKASDSVNQEFLARCNASAKIFIIAAKARKQFIVRFVANQEYCNEEQVRRAFEMIQGHATDTLRARGLASHPFKRSWADSSMETPSPFKKEFLEKFSMTRILSREDYEKAKLKQSLVDGATKIILEAK